MNYSTKHRGIILLYIFALLAFPHIMNAQVTIGSDIEPHVDAILDLKQKQDGTSDKGLLLPRVTLVDESEPFPLISHVEGMLVYNQTDNIFIKPGVFYNNGTQWKRIDILPGGTANQVLTLNSSLEPVWGELDIVDEASIGYVMKQFTVSNNSTGGLFDKNRGYDITKLNHPLDTSWVKLDLSPSFSVTPTSSKNRLIVTMQTMVQSGASANNRGWVDFAGAIFINNQLKVVKVGQFSHTGLYAFEIMTMYLIMEDMPVGELQEIELGVSRLDSHNQQNSTETIGIGIPVPGVSNLNNFMAKPFISIQYYEDPSSSTN